MRDCAGFQWRRRTGRSQWYLMLTTMRTSRWPTHCITESESDDRISLQCMRTLRIVKFPPSVLSSGWDQWRIPASSSRGEPSQFWLSSRGYFNSTVLLCMMMCRFWIHYLWYIHIFNVDCPRWFRSNILVFRLLEVWDHKGPRTVTIVCEMLHQATWGPESYTKHQETPSNKGPCES